MVELQIGVSGFRIDLGVRHPEHPERFLAGIECDGASYHSSKNARDRDRLREEVLPHGLGWDIVRVWSTDWFDNPTLQTERLVRQLEALRKRSKSTYVDYPAIGGDVPTGGTDEAAAADVGDTGGEALIPDVPLFNGTLAAEQSKPKQLKLSLVPSISTGVPIQVDRRLSIEEARSALEEFRRSRIEVDFPGAEPQRSILRPAMIERILEARFDDPDDFFSKIPEYLRRSTDARQKKYLEEICAIVAAIDDGSSRPDDSPRR